MNITIEKVLIEPRERKVELPQWLHEINQSMVILYPEDEEVIAALEAELTKEILNGQE